MNLLEMTRGGNSKYSQLSVAVSPSDTSIAVQDISYFISVPNYATIGVDNDAEVIYYTGIDTTNSLLTGCVRGESGTVPNVWPVSTYVYNAITSTLVNNMIDNITTVSNGISGSGLLINSNFSVWQRATSYTVTTTANYGGPDRWKFKQVSGAPVISQLTATSGLKCTGGSCTMMYLMDAYDLANVQGQVCTLSYKLNGSVKTTQFTPSSQTVVSFTLANGDQLEWVKLELGSQATGFIITPITLEILNCYRYYIGDLKAVCTRTIPDGWWSVGQNFPVLMRTTPTVKIGMTYASMLGWLTDLTPDLFENDNKGINMLHFNDSRLSSCSAMNVKLSLDAEI